MAFDAEEIRLAPTGHVYLADLGTALPTTLADLSANPSWRELGYLGEDGVSLTPGIDTNGIKVWQELSDVKTVLTGISLDAKINMMQVNQNTTAEYFFGTSWTNSGGLAKLSLSSNPPLAKRSMVIDWTDDGGYSNRVILSSGLITDRDAMVLSKSDNTAFGVTFHCLSAAGALGFIYSNNPDLVPAT